MHQSKRVIISIFKVCIDYNELIMQENLRANECDIGSYHHSGNDEKNSCMRAHMLIAHGQIAVNYIIKKRAQLM